MKTIISKHGIACLSRPLVSLLAGTLILGPAWGVEFGPPIPTWVGSVHAYFQQREVVFEPGLIGKWRPTEASEVTRFQFERQGTNGYKMTYIEEGHSTNEMQAQCFKLKGTLFVDICAPEAEASSPLPPPPIPSHLLLRIDQLTPTLHLAVMDNDWVGDYLKKRPTAFQDDIIQDQDNRVVLTGRTAKLQRFFLKRLKSQAAWQSLPEFRKE